MKCEEFWNGMPELKSRPLLSSDQTVHVAECPACARMLHRQHALAEGLRKVAADLRHMQAPAGVEGRLLEAFRRESGVAPITVRRSWIPALSWASAAAAVIAAGLVLVPKHNPTPPRPAAHRHSGAIELAAAPARPEAIQPDAAQDEETADTREGFIPLPNAAQVGPNEDVNVVRMEMPRSAMMAVGIDVSDDRAAERVEADVMLGSDGLPRAVRFVDPEGY